MEQANLTFQFQPRPTWVLETSFSAGNGKHLTTGCYNPNMIPFSAVIAGKMRRRSGPTPTSPRW